LIIHDGHKAELRNAISRKYSKQFWITFAVFTGIILIVVLAFLVLKDSTVWYSSDPWYPILFVMKELFPWIIAVIWISGVALFLFMQWRRSATDIVALVDSIEMMQYGRAGDVIKAPANLKELEPVMQAMFDTALRDKRAAEEAEKRKSDLILYLAHDLKTPLTSTIGYLNLLHDSEDLDEAKREAFTQIALTKAMRLETLVEQFSEISKLNLQDIVLVKTYFSLNLLMAQIADEFFPLLEEEGKTVSLAIDEDIQVYGDAGLLARVFNNILQNAIVYSDPHSTISMQAVRRADALEVVIANMGETIPPEQLEKIFEKFYRLDESRGSQSGGSGLGLAIAREIVIKHGGTISAQSSYGKTEFIITLPLTS